jgi:hypothetical protein
MNRRAFIRTSVGVVAVSTFDAASSRGSTSNSRATSNPVSALENVSLADLIDNYVAVWNEPDPSGRRRRIESVWAKDGITCYERSLARGYEEIEKRVTGSWEKWLKDGKHIFKPAKIARHHDIVRFEFVMASVPDDRVEDRGLCLLIFDGNGRIHSDLQFNPTTNEAGKFADRYLALLNEEDENVQRNRLIELWAPDATYVGQQSVKYGHTDLLASVRERQRTNAKAGLAFASGNASDAHHNFVTFRWRIENRPSGVLAGSGSELVILDESGRIRIDYQFEEPL